MYLRGKRAASRLLVVSALFAASPAIAMDVDIPPLTDSLRFEVVGVVAADCRLSQSITEVTIDGAADPLTNRARAAQGNLPFSVSCNTPASVALSSRHGGLSFQGVSSTDRDFTGLITYAARVMLPQRPNALSCRSAEMAEGGSGCAAELQDALMEGDGAIEVTLETGDAMLQRGTYSDNLTITITPLVGGG